MVTGAETTASAITFTLYHVAANSAAEEKVLREVDDFGRNSRFGYDDLGKVHAAQWLDTKHGDMLSLRSDLWGYMLHIELMASGTFIDSHRVPRNKLA